jgi:hypothetical protein
VTCRTHRSDPVGSFVSAGRAAVPDDDVGAAVGLADGLVVPADAVADGLVGAADAVADGLVVPADAVADGLVVPADIVDDGVVAPLPTLVASSVRLVRPVTWVARDPPTHASTSPVVPSAMTTGPAARAVTVTESPARSSTPGSVTRKPVAEVEAVRVSEGRQTVAEATPRPAEAAPSRHRSDANTRASTDRTLSTRRPRIGEPHPDRVPVAVKIPPGDGLGPGRTDG